MFKKLMLVFLLYLGGVNLACADEIGDLRQQLQELRQDHEIQIQGLQQKMDELSKKQDAAQRELEEKLEKRIEEKSISLDYVGVTKGRLARAVF